MIVYGLKQETIDAIKKIFSQFQEVETVILYGSRAKGTQRRGSDIDLTIKGKNLNLRLLHQIEDQLDDLLLPYIIDLSIYEHIDNPDLIDHIQGVGNVFYQKIKASLK